MQRQNKQLKARRGLREKLCKVGAVVGMLWLCPPDELLSSRERLRVRSVEFCQSTFQGKAQNGAMGGAGEQGQTKDRKSVV